MRFMCIISLISLSIIVIISFSPSEVISKVAIDYRTNSHILPDYYSSEDYPIYHTISDLNKDLFCSLKTNSTSGDIIAKGFSKLLKHILSIQYPSNCSDPSNKFFIFDHSCNVGLMASLECLAYYFGIALFQNRTFLLRGKWTFGSMDSYFIPVSNCSVEKVLSEHNNSVNSSILILNPENIQMREKEFGVKINKQWFNAKPGIELVGLYDTILIMPDIYGWHRLQVGSTINKQLDTYYDGLNRIDYVNLMKAYLLRMQPLMKKIVNNIVSQSLSGIYNNHTFNYLNSVSIMIRWGDKCYNAGHYPHAEMYCFTYNEYMNIIKELKLIQPNVKYIIVTSETRQIIENITKEWDKYMNNNNMRFIVNIGDIMHGSSTMDRFSVSDDATKIVTGMLSTIRLQFSSFYYTLAGRSFWNMGIYSMIQTLQCTPFNTINNHKNDIIGKRMSIKIGGSTKWHTVTWNYQLSEMFKNKLQTSDKEFEMFGINNVRTNH